MHSILFKIGAINIYSYGVMVSLGFGLGAFLIYRRSQDEGFDKNLMMDLVVLTLLAGLAGARLLYVLINIGYYMANPFEVFNLSKGGLVWYGGFLAGIACAVWYIKQKRLDFWAVSDFIIPYVALAQAIGRIGCFLNGCCYGKAVPSDYTFGAAFPGMMSLCHPTELYASLALILIFIALRLWQDLPHFKGGIFTGYCLLYSLKRFSIEFFRGDNPEIAYGLTLSQIISVFVFGAALIIFLYKGRQWKK